MCVINLKRRVKGPVVAYKLVERINGRLYGIRNFRYKINKLHISPGGPGFQAFVYKKDAASSQREAWEDFIVRKVLLYRASKGTITYMDEHSSNGKPGWTAEKIRIPPKNKA